MMAWQSNKEDQGCGKFHVDKTASVRLRLTCTQLCMNLKLTQLYKYMKLLLSTDPLFALCHPLLTKTNDLCSEDQ